ncbi:MAG: bifunctional diaminohydroxyphosphoribosylaminopyrimidine deaminase/5-amino-6-(5-phosphoribosylamino)uracil reductase RibD [Chitinophagaceae bacterium]|nr:bifunctional diaminohydroxyphosphoribosylaminopyrimidine deaminase/5-amino-6-(5-phosphoribosylamino)uracil reductase RibD [Chitinophagaceae bacterium]
MNQHEIYMHRCIELALLGMGSVAPNPMVGAVLVHEGRIIGEGYHKNYGGPHAEVECLRSVKQEDEPLIEDSVLYVSLEPCVHFGKTPPCADLIIAKQIPEVVIGIRDPFERVDGKGIEKLRAAGIKMTVGVLQELCRQLNKRFFAFHALRRPFIMLKWAQSVNGKIANSDMSRVYITNAVTNRVVHKWRSEEQAIMIGTNTAFYDNPSLTTRLWEGKSPLRLVIDPGLRLPLSLKIFDGSAKTVVFNTEKQETLPGFQFYQVEKSRPFIPQVINALHIMDIQSVLVEGGARTLRSFIEEGLWDEARVITNNALVIPGGLDAPELEEGIQEKSERIMGDTIRYYINKII